MSRYAFRAATLILERIERRKISFDRAFVEIAPLIVPKAHQYLAYEYALNGILYYRAADLLLSREKISSSLRRICAFRVAFSLLMNRRLGITIEDLRLIAGGLLTGKMLELLRKISRISFEDFLKEIPSKKILGVKYAVPDWLVKELLEIMDRKELERLLEAMLKPVTWARINTLKSDKRKIVKKLASLVEVRWDKDYEFMFEVVKGREKLVSSTLVKDGFVVLHDKGSVVVVEALSPKISESILDLAAAPGIKSSLIAQLTKNRARIVAFDISYNRIKDMRSLMKKLNAVNVDLAVLDSTKLKLAKKFKKILVDAPCSNTGALSSDPGLRLALRDIGSIDKFVKIQYAILEKAVENLERGGVVVYSTCSLLPQEGEFIVEKIEEKYGVSIDTNSVLGVSGYRNSHLSSKVRRLFPHINRTTGFFIARIYV